MKKLLFLSLIMAVTQVHAQQLFTVYFDLDKYLLTPHAKEELDRFIEDQKAAPVLTIYLNGYCDPAGSDSYNLRLSDRRVASVKNYLTAHGIKAETIVLEKGNGERIQVNENATPEHRAQNRRVQVSFTNTVVERTGLTEKIKDTATRVGSNIVLKNINFYGGRHQFLPSAAPTLVELLSAMQSNPGLVIHVEGHICCEEGTGDGLDTETGENKLSYNRAQAVRDYLVSNGVDDKRVSFTGYGHSNPVHPYPEATEQQRTENRRVEIKILSK